MLPQAIACGNRWHAGPRLPCQTTNGMATPKTRMGRPSRTEGAGNPRSDELFLLTYLSILMMMIVIFGHFTFRTGSFGESMLSMMLISRPSLGSTATSAGKVATT